MWPAVKIRIISTEANRRGDLFGRLMSDLFLSLGYDNIRLEIQRSGREIDIEAEHRLEAHHAFAECKALEEKAGGAELNKFAGKLRPERSRRTGRTIAGYFISLSGFTETAVDQETEAGHEAIILIDGPRVIRELIKGRILVSLEVATTQAGRSAAPYPHLSLDETPEIFAHKMGWLWAIYFCQGKQRTHFVLIHADGTPLSADLAASVAQDSRDVYQDISQMGCLNPLLSKEPDEQALLSSAIGTYKAYLRAECGSIMLDGLPADADVGALRLRLENLFVPLHVIVDLGVDASMSPVRARRRTTGKSQPFGGLLQLHRRLAILASPGGGKSTLLKRLAIAYTDPERRQLVDDRLPDCDWLPIFLRCRELRERARAPFLELLDTLADRALMSDGKRAFRTYLVEALRAGRVLLLVDGLDEITSVGDRAAFVRSLRTFLAIYPDVNIVVTSRKAGFRHVAGLIASMCLQAEIADFTTEDIERLTISWHREVLGDRPEIIADARALARTICMNDRIKRLAANPLLLTALLLVKRWVGQLPTKRSILYGKAVEVLLMTWNVEGHEPLEQDEALPQLCYVAFSMMQGGNQKISRAELTHLLANAREDLLAELAFARIGVQELIDRIESRSSLLMMSGHDIVDGTLTEFYEFRHLTFQEYLTAKATVEGWYPGRNDTETLVSLLEQHFADEKWREVIPLAAVLAGRRAEPLVRRLIDLCGTNETGRIVTATLAKCLADEVQVAPETIRQAVIALLNSPGGWMPERLLICRGKYGPLLRKEASIAYLNNSILRPHLLRVVGEAVLTTMVHTAIPVWEQLKLLCQSENVIARCEGALGVKATTDFDSKHVEEVIATLIPLLWSGVPAEQIAGCVGLHQVARKKLRGARIPNPNCAAFAVSTLLEPLLRLWMYSGDPLCREWAVRVLCVIPLHPHIEREAIGERLINDFLLRVNLWTDLSQDEKVAGLVVAVHLKAPWDKQHVRSLAGELRRNFRKYRERRLTEIEGEFAGDEDATSVPASTEVPKGSWIHTTDLNEPV
jgi:hypothetical protein